VNIMPPQDELPPAWRQRLAHHQWSQQTIGRSSAAVFRLTAPDGTILFVKTEPAGPLGELAGEAARLRWLATRGIACPRVLAFEDHANRQWLLISALPGHDLASSTYLPAQTSVLLVAQALRALHGLDVRDCPFDHRLDHRIAAAQACMIAGAVDEQDFDDERSGRTAASLFAELLARRPQTEDLVVTHGDACLPNMIADDGRFTGFVDCGRLGVADRYQDLALAGWSIRYNLGAPWVEPFLRHYGLSEADADRLAYYRLLDEFF